MARIIVALSGITFLGIGLVLGIIKGFSILPIVFLIVGLGDLAAATVLPFKK